MILAIGIMIGLYILARYIEMSERPDISISRKILLVVFVFITVVCMLVLLINASSISSLAQSFFVK
jgi:hypothetical protein